MSIKGADRKSPWTVLVATKHLEHLGFSSIRPWPRVDEPGVFRHHVWGKKFDENKTSDPQPTLLVLAHSSVARADQTSCAGVPFIPSGISKSAQEGMSCLMPGCKHCFISRTEAKSINWPFCSVEETFESPFYPSTKSAAFSALWVTFDPQSLLPGLQASNGNDGSKLVDRIGHLPYQLVKSLSLEGGAQLDRKQEYSIIDSSSESNWWIQIRSGMDRILSTSYTLCLLGRYLRTSGFSISLFHILIALQLILILLLSAVLHLPNFSPSSQHLCHIYHQTMSQLTSLSLTLQSKNLSSKFSGSCGVIDLFIRNPTACSALEGPTQQTPTDILNSFLVVAWGALRHGCVLELTASSTDHFASELNRLLIWLGSSEPAGWKINRSLAILMSRFFISHIVAWRFYVHFLIQITSGVFEWLYAVFVVRLHLEYFHLFILLLSTVFLQVMLNRGKVKGVLIDLISSSTRLAASLIICIGLDIFMLGTLHLCCFYVYTVRLFRVQLLTVEASWRLCRSGSKWNPLRGRVDTIPQNDDIPPVVANAVLISSENQGQTDSETECLPSGQSRHLDRVFVATFLGVATGLCLLPTTVAFYASFSVIFIILVCIKGILTRLVCWILSFPLEAVLLWFFNIASIRTDLVVISPVLDSVRVPFLTIELARGSFQKILKENTLFDTNGLFGRRYSVGEIVKSLICANLLYPLSEKD
nr:phosphatidylinositol [Hymenolepis microstoma]